MEEELQVALVGVGVLRGGVHDADQGDLEEEEEDVAKGAVQAEGPLCLCQLDHLDQVGVDDGLAFLDRRKDRSGGAHQGTQPAVLGLQTHRPLQVLDERTPRVALCSGVTGPLHLDVQLVGE